VIEVVKYNFKQVYSIVLLYNYCNIIW